LEDVEELVGLVSDGGERDGDGLEAVMLDVLQEAALLSLQWRSLGASSNSVLLVLLNVLPPSHR
jgi:hypothetical protein